MMTKREIYNSKKITLKKALNLIKSGDCIVTSAYGCEPSDFLRELHTIADHVENVKLWTMLVMGEYPVMSDDSLKGRIDILSFFYDSNGRKNHAGGRYEYIPMNLHSVGTATVNACRPNVYVCSVTPMDENGNVHISFDLQGAWEWMECAEIVIFEINEDMPVVYGDTAVPIEKATYLYEAGSRPLPEIESASASIVEKAIAGHVSSLIHDGDCIQLGIGGMPGAVGEALLEKKDLGIHTEMITASMGRLMRAGAVTNERKNINKGKTIGGFAWGDADLYDFMSENPMIEMRRCSYTNDPFVIAQNDNMISVNTALQLDLTGQICSESIGTRQFSGTGGATDFAYGAYHSKGGRGIIAIPSTAKNGTISKIVPQLTAGAVVSISRNLVDYIVTEYGIAHLRDKSIRERVRNLIAVAHPDFRADLKWQANKLMLW